jgi:hypothetical protein
MKENEINKTESNKRRALFDVLTKEKEVKRIVARNLKGGFLASLKLFDENTDYKKTSNLVNMGIEIPFDISQPTDKKGKLVEQTLIPSDLKSAFSKLAMGTMPDYSELAMLCALIIQKRNEKGLQSEGLKELREHYRNGVASEKRGISIKKTITEIAKDFQEEKQLSSNQDYTQSETNQIGQALKKQNQRDDAPPVIPRNNQRTR